MFELKGEISKRWIALKCGKKIRYRGNGFDRIKLIYLNRW